MKLSHLLSCLRDHRLIGAGDPAADPEIGAIRYRSTDIRPGDLFVAIPGFRVDGHQFAGDAIERGAAAVVTEKQVPLDRGVQILVSNTRRAMAILADQFYGRPSEKLTVIGITGTNGKTTTAYLIESILARAGIKTGVIGTINYRYDNKTFNNPMTTPESVDLQRILADMVASGVTHAVIETSSHAIDLERVTGCRIRLGVFTNLSQDHLDFHGTMDAYWSSKKKLFTDILPRYTGADRSTAVINCDDGRGGDLYKMLNNANGAVRPISVGTRAGCDLAAETSEITMGGITTTVTTPAGKLAIHSKLVGRYNLENILCAVGTATALGLPAEMIQAGIETFTAVPGRMEPITDPRGRHVFVDYAHTPDALDSVLKTLAAIATGRLVCVFGCGGDRDRTKRPLMGAIAGKIADLTVVTSDNPRTEDPDAIIADILAGLTPLKLRHYPADTVDVDARGFMTVPDRRTAIRCAIRLTGPNDTVLIAGKGHETYQIIGRRETPFDDREEARQALEGGHA